MAPNELRVRLEPELRERLDAFSTESKRSVTNAVNYLLEKALDAEDAKSQQAPGTSP